MARALLSGVRPCLLVFVGNDDEEDEEVLVVSENLETRRGSELSSRASSWAVKCARMRSARGKSLMTRQV
jgi:nucleotide-binding universal stress UspA family protein